MSDVCPFCGRDPFHYVDNGVGMEAVAVTCCNLGDAYFRGMRPDPETVEMDWGEFRKIGHRLAALAQPASAQAGVAELVAALRACLVQAEGCWLNHYGENPEGSAESEHIAKAKAALAALNGGEDG